MGLLCNSGTFLGVLVTMIVLCAYMNNNNFIHEILKDIQQRVSKQINEANTNTDIETAIKSTASYKLLQRVIKDANTPSELLDEALNLDLRIQSQCDIFRGAITPDFLKPAQDTMQLIDDSREQFMGPLYTLFICIIVFIGDETIMSAECLNWGVITVITLVIIASYLFWGWIWFSYIKTVQDCLKHNGLGNTKSKCRVLCFCGKINYKAGMAGIIILNSITLFAIAVLPMPIFICRFIYFLSLIIPVVLMALHRTSMHISLGVYSYEFLLKHFLMILCLAISITALFFVGAYLDTNIENISIEYSNIMLKISILLFVLLNGLILPFIFPYLAYKLVLMFALKKAEREKLNAWFVRMEIDQQLNDFCDKI